MKTSISPAGILEVEAENDTEAYALRRWAEDNLTLHEETRTYRIKPGAAVIWCKISPEDNVPAPRHLS